MPHLLPRPGPVVNSKHNTYHKHQCPSSCKGATSLFHTENPYKPIVQCTWHTYPSSHAATTPLQVVVCATTTDSPSDPDTVLIEKLASRGRRASERTHVLRSRVARDMQKSVATAVWLGDSWWLNTTVAASDSWVDGGVINTLWICMVMAKVQVLLGVVGKIVWGLMIERERESVCVWSCTGFPVRIISIKRTLFWVRDYSWTW